MVGELRGFGTPSVGMSFAMKEKKMLDPVGVTFTCGGRIVFQADGILHLFKQLLGTVLHSMDSCLIFKSDAVRIAAR
jgi:hypothetical protein